MMKTRKHRSVCSCLLQAVVALFLTDSTVGEVVTVLLRVGAMMTQLRPLFHPYLECARPSCDANNQI